MTPATAAPPDPTSVQVEPAPPPAPPTRANRPDRSFGRALRWGLALSVLVHLAFFILSPSMGPFQVDSVGPGVERDDGREALRAIIPVQASETPAPAATAAADEAEPVRPAISPTDAPLDDVDPVAAEAADRVDHPASPGRGRNPLIVGERDPRLNVQPRDPEDEPALVPTRHEEYMRHLQARIDAVNDSLGLISERERRAMDWTTTDGEGRRWGISPDGIHLGPITLPPVPLRGYGGHEDAARERDRQRDEIRNQEAAGDRDRARREAAEETRRRRDRERGGD